MGLEESDLLGVHEIRASFDAHVNLQLAGNFRTATYGKQFHHLLKELLHHLHAMSLQYFGHHKEYSNHIVKMKGTKWEERELGLQKLGVVDNFQLAGLFQTAVKRRSMNGIPSLNKKPKETQDKHQQIWEECKKERIPFGEEIMQMKSVDSNSEILKHKDITSSPWYVNIPFLLLANLSFQVCCHHAPLVRKGDHVSCLLYLPMAPLVRHHHDKGMGVVIRLEKGRIIHFKISTWEKFILVCAGVRKMSKITLGKGKPSGSISNRYSLQPSFAKSLLHWDHLEKDHNSDFLIDEGLTHSSMFEKKVRRIRGKGSILVWVHDIHTYQPFREKGLLHNQGVTMLVGSGTLIPCARKIVQLSLLLGDHEVCGEFLVIELANVEIVLGVQWLQTLGKSTLNFHNEELKFCDKVEEIRIHGKKKQHRTAVLGQQVRHLQFENFPQRRLLTLGKNIYYHKVNFEEPNGVKNTTFSHRYRAGLSQVQDGYDMENPDGLWKCKANHFLEPSFTLENKGIK
ncbi:hypothetical protein KI387_038896, partial [Taxus chinensis]